MDDLIDTDFGEHDYDWLIAPPKTPHVHSSDATDHQIPPAVSRGRSTVRSVSTARASRVVSASQLQNGHSTKPARCISLTRPSILNTYSSLSINGNYNRTSFLNTSIASVTCRPSTPGNRSTTAKPSLTSRPLPASSQTPAKAKPAHTSLGVKTTKSFNSQPSTRTSQIPTNSNPTTSSSPRLHSRSSTPTRKPTNPLPASTTGRATSVGRVRNTAAAATQPSSPSPHARAPVKPNDIPDFPSDAPPTTGRATSVGQVRNPAAAATRPSSPSPHARAPVQPIDIPDFPSDAPPNLRTRLPERPASSGRVRPGTALTTRANLNSQNVVSAGSSRRHSLPVVSHSKFPENSPRAQMQSNGHDAVLSQIHKSVVSEDGVRMTNKVDSVTESTGFGRTISKKSLDMALRHMDIKQSIGGIRGTSLFPHSIRSNAPKGRPARMSDPVVQVTTDEVVTENGSCNGIASPDCNRTISCNGDSAPNKSPQQKPLVKKESDFDPYGSSRYDAMLLKEESNNMNWLHSVEDKSDQSPVFDHRFEPLPEPFGLL